MWQTVKKLLGLTRRYPLCLLGYDIRRWETIDASHQSDIYFPGFEHKLLFNESMPFYGPTHLQYWSKWGFLIQWPLCFHAWYQFREQKVDDIGRRIPSSEIVAYLRIGLARWWIKDNETVYDMPTLYLGGHWD